MAKRKKRSWYRRHEKTVLAVIVLIQSLVVIAMALSPCTVTVRPVEMPKVTPQIKPPYQWGQKA